MQSEEDFLKRVGACIFARCVVLFPHSPNVKPLCPRSSVEGLGQNRRGLRCCAKQRCHMFPNQSAAAEPGAPDY